MELKIAFRQMSLKWPYSISFDGHVPSNQIYYSYISIILFAIGGGFIYKGIFGSNNEKQINKVFWHETRFLHGMLYILSGFYLFKENINMTSLVLLLDLISSFFYRSYEIKKMF